jgi:hypothetical protein
MTANCDNLIKTLNLTSGSEQVQKYESHYF